MHEHLVAAKPTSCQHMAKGKPTLFLAASVKSQLLVHPELHAASFAALPPTAEIDSTSANWELEVNGE